MSGAQRRKLKRNPSLFTRQQVEQHVAGELDAHRVALANQRARVRDARLAPSTRNQAAASSAQTDDRAAALFEHINEAT